MLSGQYHPFLVAISIFVAIFASYTGFSLAERVRSSQGRAAVTWTAGGAFALGMGIWAMHFIGMLAFELPIEIGYDVPITLLSLLLPVAVCGAALWQLRHRVVATRRLAAAALLMGAGINGMHYTGMAAMRMDPGIVYDPFAFGASVLLAVAASAGALWIAYRLRQRTPRATLIQGAAAVVMGLAIAGMHYTGMAAAHFPLGSVCRAAGPGIDPMNLALLVTLGTGGILTFALIVSIYDARLEARTHVLAASLATAEERRTQFQIEHEARLQLERLSVLKDEFLATLSHELRTPLNAVLGWSQLLQQGGRDEATLHRGLTAIERNARAQVQMIDDLLDMSGIIAGKVQVALAPVWPAEFVGAAVDAIRPAALARGIDVLTEIDRQAGPVLADPARMQQVMGNLLSNAVKFTEPGGRISIALAVEAAGQVTVRVVDTGAGIAPDFLPHVFDRFRQADASTTRRHGGLGLGLSIVRQLVDLQGGTIRAASAGPGQGATFTVTLPLAAHLAPSRAPAMPVATAEQVDLGGVVIVAADDQPDTLDVLKRFLVAANSRVFTAGSGVGAINLVASIRPALLICDITMPGMDGYEVLGRVRALPGCHHLPAIALTALANANGRQQALDAGFTGHLAKPIGPTQLVHAVAALLAQRERV